MPLGWLEESYSILTRSTVQFGYEHTSSFVAGGLPSFLDRALRFEALVTAIP
jgi:hypothetical protein